MGPAATDGLAWLVGLSLRLSVCLSVALFVTTISRAKMAEPIDMPHELVH